MLVSGSYPTSIFGVFVLGIVNLLSKDHREALNNTYLTFCSTHDVAMLTEQKQYKFIGRRYYNMI